MTLFINKEITLHSGLKSDFKIEADSLSDEDLATLALLISRKMKFKKVVGVPTGGFRLASFLSKYKEEDDLLPTLLVDDVLTTGGSMIKARGEVEGYVIGVVIFARGICPEWISPIFQMWPSDPELHI